MEVSSAVLEAVEKASTDKKLSCPEARKLAEQLKVPPKIIREAANNLEIKIIACELGCF
ncbi:MAG: hypothetical protein A4E53_01245 [Pelotomaculum sp. PtaB.Bin104]|nr:MAG: hypothetical protein A4E53_01245 [Pelotomaculum sp. PtaB.Bin104]